MLTKQRMAVINVLMVAVYFVLAWIFRESVVGRGTESFLIYVSKLVFLSISATLLTAFVLIILFKRDFIKGQLATFNRYKHLLRLMIKRDFITRYRKSVLGVLWSLLHPLMMMLIMMTVFSYLFRFQIENFPVYFISGLIIYEFINESTTASMNSVIVNEGIIKKVYVPKYVFPLAKVTSSLVQLGFSFVAFLIIFMITGVSFNVTMLLLPIPIIYAFVFSFGIAMALAAMAVFFRDLTYLYSLIMRVLFFVTPLMYPIEIIPEHLRPIWALNPIGHFVDYFRSLTLHGAVPGIWDNVVCLSFAVAAFCVGIYVFIMKQDRFILYL